MTIANSGSRPMGEIVRDISTYLVELVQKEKQLAQVEMVGNAKKAGFGIALLSLASLFLFPALFAFLFAAIAALIEAGFAPHMAGLMLGAGLLLVSLGIGCIGLALLRGVGFLPTRAIRQFRSNVAAFRMHRAGQ